MESNQVTPTPDEAAAALAGAEASKAQLARGLRLPSYFFESLSAVITIQIATSAVGIAQVAGWAIWAVAGGLILFALVAAVQLARFRRLNGVWLGGFASRVVGGTGIAASTSYALALGAAVWAAFEQAWVLVAVSSLIGGAAYGLSGRRWLRAYRAEPVGHARGESALWMAVFSAIALVGLALLLIGH